MLRFNKIERGSFLIDSKVKKNLIKLNLLELFVSVVKYVQRKGLTWSQIVTLYDRSIVTALLSAAVLTPNLIKSGGMHLMLAVRMSFRNVKNAPVQTIDYCFGELWVHTLNQVLRIKAPF